MCDAEASFSLQSPEWTRLKLLLHLSNRGALRQFVHLPLFEFGKIAWWPSGHFSAPFTCFCWENNSELGTLFPRSFSTSHFWFWQHWLPSRLCCFTWTRTVSRYPETSAPSGLSSGSRLYVFPRLIWVSAAAQMLRRQLAGGVRWGQSLCARL